MEKRTVSTNPYSEEIFKSLPRILAMFDADRTSESYGYGDRYYWAWGLIDFGNATFQGAAHGFAQLWKSGFWPYSTTEKNFFEKIDSLFMGAKRLTREDGSLEEALPREGSYCVTALVAFDLICSIDLLDDVIDKERILKWTSVVSPMIEFLLVSDETHAIISNHLATAAAALAKWSKRTQDRRSETKARELLDRILDNQSEEGYFKEYEGADPGYQSLCTYYMADLHKTRPDWNLLPALRKSIRFLWHFAHPDGSFGGYYGSRSTRFYFPAGILALASEISEARALSNFLADSIALSKVACLSSMDEPNIAPMFNCYAWAAVLAEESRKDKSTTQQDNVIPCKSEKPFKKNFPDAGILVDRGADYYSVLNYKKGGVVQHYLGDKLRCINAGVVIKSSCEQFGSSQHYDANVKIVIEDSIITIKSQVAQMPKRLPTPFQFIVLRMLCFTFFRYSFFREFIKRTLVGFLITKPKLWPIWNTRKVELGRDLKISDDCLLVPGYKKISNLKVFVPIHMASQGYWQIQDEEPYE